MKSKLHEIKGKNRWCGPAAIATVTGITTDEASRIVREFTGNTKCTATWPEDLSYAFSELGWSMRRMEQYHQNPPTLARWLRLTRQMDTIYLVAVTRHWVIVKGRKIADSKHRVPVFLRQFKGRRKRVRRVWMIRPS